MDSLGASLGFVPGIDNKAQTNYRQTQPECDTLSQFCGVQAGRCGWLVCHSSLAPKFGRLSLVA